MTIDEHSAAERMQYQLRLIDSIARHAGQGQHDLADAGSDLAADDALLGAHQTSHLVGHGHCISVSQDALMTARLILLDPDSGGLRVPLVGQYPVLRTSLESASLAIWLLAPEYRDERVRRSLQARMACKYCDTCHLASGGNNVE